jgi:hypothetical protein
VACYVRGIGGDEHSELVMLLRLQMVMANCFVHSIDGNKRQVLG